MPSIRRGRARAFGSLAVLVLAWSLLTGARGANELLKAGDYPAAIAALRAEESARPRSAPVKRNLGIALLESGDVGAAHAKLLEARVLSPRDPLVLFFLGRAADRAGQSGEAIEAYRAYLTRGGREAGAVRGRLRELTLASMKASARSAITAEKRLRADSIPTNTIAVPQFSTPSGVDSLVRLCRGLALVMTTDLSKVPSLRVVERERLGVLLEELDLGAQGAKAGSGVATPDAVSARYAPRVGLLLGTRRFAQGGLVPLRTGEVQLDASLVDAVDGDVSPGAPVQGPLSDVLGLEKVLVYQVLDSLDVPVTPALRKAIGPPPTKSFRAFMAFCHGLDYEERGLMEQAGAAYDEAASIDPGFTMAQEYGDALEVSAADASTLETQLVSEAAGDDDFDDRLMRSAFETGFGPGPEGDTRSGIDPRLSPSERTGGRQLIIRGTFK